MKNRKFNGLVLRLMLHLSASLKGGLLLALAICCVNVFAEIADLPTESRQHVPPALRSGQFTLTDADRDYWAFQPIRRPAIPKVKSQRQVAGTIDAHGNPFVL